jgi:hypothetical protein
LLVRFHPNSVAGRDLSELYNLVAVPAMSEYGRRATVVGYFFGIVPWRVYISDILDGFETVSALLTVSSYYSPVLPNCRPSLFPP